MENRRKTRIRKKEKKLATRQERISSLLLSPFSALPGEMTPSAV